MRNKVKSEAADLPQSRISPALLVSLIALLVSMASAYQSRSTARDTASTTIIRDEYAVFNDLAQTQVNNSECNHIFVLSPLYAYNSALVQDSVADRSPAMIKALQLKEGAIALMIFTRFEEAFYEWKQAVSSGDTDRASFMEEVLNYFTGRLLRNPRLLWYWSPSGGNLALYY
ncbi:MAG TPA: hypothetical protein VGG20_07970, partial [Thermoanaerobaculia bacterium]